MGYSIDLDEYTSKALRDELWRRETATAQGKCDYCGRTLGVEPSCKFPERHKPKK